MHFHKNSILEERGNLHTVYWCQHQWVPTKWEDSPITEKLTFFFSLVLIAVFSTSNLLSHRKGTNKGALNVKFIVRSIYVLGASGLTLKM